MILTMSSPSSLQLTMLLGHQQNWNQESAALVRAISDEFVIRRKRFNQMVSSRLLTIWVTEPMVNRIRSLVPSSIYSGKAKAKVHNRRSEDSETTGCYRCRWILKLRFLAMSNQLRMQSIPSNKCSETRTTLRFKMRQATWATYLWPKIAIRSHASIIFNWSHQLQTQMVAWVRIVDLMARPTSVNSWKHRKVNPMQLHQLLINSQGNSRQKKLGKYHMKVLRDMIDQQTSKQSLELFPKGKQAIVLWSLQSRSIQILSVQCMLKRASLINEMIVKDPNSKSTHRLPSISSHLRDKYKMIKE